MAEINPLLAGRWSPRAFDQDYAMTDEQMTLLLEAARWAPSAMNLQPWGFVTGLRGGRTYEQLTGCAQGHSDWALSASGLILGACRLSGRELELSLYDLGDAVAHLSIEAESLGLHLRQFATFDRGLAVREFGIDEPWVPVIMLAVGRAVESGRPERERKPLAELRPWG
ncbi:nitroreductase family protein [Propionibacterium sp.]|uniref:nitroreductase family protein n=1 Tax=Propionibacterium sp. TaxID=1977903 RepID=UPI0039EBD232